MLKKYFSRIMYRRTLKGLPKSRPRSVRSGVLCECPGSRRVSAAATGSGGSTGGGHAVPKIGSQARKFHFHQLLARPGELHCGDTPSNLSPLPDASSTRGKIRQYTTFDIKLTLKMLQNVLISSWWGNSNFQGTFTHKRSKDKTQPESQLNLTPAVNVKLQQI